MPRLLLVDDNPSIHKIAETLLATSDVQLVSCGSGAQALALIEQGDRFDVALLDTSMMEMDGWTLLQRLRAMEATARMPVAMMAGVLDIVDPEQLRLAPIQGFLKKPVELRDLGERIKRLMETPVPAPEPAPEPDPIYMTQPGLRIPDELKAVALEEDDLLLLGPEDLLSPAPEDLRPEASKADLLEFDAQDALAFQDTPGRQEAPAGLETAAADEGEPLDLEELDLEGLRNLNFTAPAEPASASVTDSFAIPEFLMADTLPDGPEALPEPAPAPPIEAAGITPEGLSFSEESLGYADESLVFTEDFPDLGPVPDPAGGPEAAAMAIPESALRIDEPLDWSDDSDSLVGMALNDLNLPSPPRATQPFEPELTTEPEAITLSDILDPPAAGLELPLPIAQGAHEPEPESNPEIMTLSDILDPEPAPVAAITPPASQPWLEPTPSVETPAWLDQATDVTAEALPEPPPPAEHLPGAGPSEPAFADHLAAAGACEPATAVVSEAAAAAHPAPVAAGDLAPAPADPLAALLADPVLMDRLAKALVARMGDQVLREIAWELMPELAERLNQKGTP